MFQVLSRTPLFLCKTISKPPLIAPYYHIISDDRVPHVEHLFPYKNRKQFKKDLDCLLRNYQPMGLAEAIQCIRAGMQFPPKRFLLSFDDGYREVAENVAPLLAHAGIPATFFINSAFLDNKQLGHRNKLSLLVEAFDSTLRSTVHKEILRQLAAHGIDTNGSSTAILAIPHDLPVLVDSIAALLEFDFENYLQTRKPFLSTEQIHHVIKLGFTIGGHSIDHPDYSLLSVENQVHQTVESVRYVRDIFELNYGCFAFPFSDDGISLEFFWRSRNSGIIDISFGAAGLIGETRSNHIQRISLETPFEPAERILAFQHLHYGVKSWTQRRKFLQKTRAGKVL